MVDTQSIYLIWDLLIIPVAIAFRLFYTLGGWPEAPYRIFRIVYFVPFIRQPDGQVKRYVLKWDRIATHSPATFTIKGPDGVEAEFMVDETLQSRSNGRPAWFYNWNDTRPIPFNPSEDRCDPIIVHKMLSNKVVADIHREGEKKRKRGGIWLAIMLIGIVGMIGYIGWLVYNVYCGQAPGRC